MIRRGASLLRESLCAALDLALPRVCVACERIHPAGTPGSVCGLCWTRVTTLPSPICLRCGHPVTGACGWCELLPPYVRSARSVCWMPAVPASKIIGALKYGGWTCVASDIASRMARLSWPHDVLLERTAVVAVPLAKGKETERGYNQSALLASALGKLWQMPVWNECVSRTRETRSQTELAPEDRRANVDGSVRFNPRPGITLAGAHVVIVDDVITTAATLNECARALYDAGARVISYVTFGRARSARDRI